jgi:hypothetical protein
MGGILVLGAFLVSPGNVPAQEANTIVSVAPDRTFIEPSDTDGDGTEDWREELPQNTAIELPEKREDTPIEPYEEPATFTGKFAKALFTDYVQTKSFGSLNQENFVQSALASIESSTRGRSFTRLDITIVPDSPEALHAYGNAMAVAFAQDEVFTENQLLVLERAVKTQDREALKELDTIEKLWSDILSESLKVPVPNSVVGNHIMYLTAVEAIRNDVEAMKGVFEDPLYALSRVKQHTDNITGFLAVIKRITTTLLASGVSYEKDEPGAIIYLIEI